MAVVRKEAGREPFPFPLCYWSFPGRGLPSGYAKAYFPLGLLCSLRRVVKLADKCRPSVLEDGVDSGVRRRVTLPGRLLGAPTWLSCNRPGSRPTTSHMLGQPTSPTCTCVCVSVCVAIFCPASTPAPWHVQRSRGAPPPRTTFTEPWLSGCQVLSGDLSGCRAAVRRCQVPLSDQLSGAVSAVRCCRVRV